MSSAQREVHFRFDLAEHLFAGLRFFACAKLAGSVWTSIFALRLIRQQTLIIAGLDDPIIPLANARILHRLLPNSTFHLHSGGHVDLITNAAELAPVIEMFRTMG